MDNSQLLKLIAYGLMKFDYDFITEYGYESYREFYAHIVSIGIAKTIDTVKGWRDTFDGINRHFNYQLNPQNTRRGYDFRDYYINYYNQINNLYADFNASDFVLAVKSVINIDKQEYKISVPPVFISRYKQLQQTGLQAEVYFINNYLNVEPFYNSKLVDARIFGDGYDFQITTETNNFYLVEVKGIRKQNGKFRFTSNEYNKACEYANNYFLSIVSNLDDIPTISVIKDPYNILMFDKKVIRSEQVYYVGQF